MSPTANTANIGSRTRVQDGGNGSNAAAPNPAPAIGDRSNSSAEAPGPRARRVEGTEQHGRSVGERQGPRSSGWKTCDMREPSVLTRGGDPGRERRATRRCAGLFWSQQHAGACQLVVGPTEKRKCQYVGTKDNLKLSCWAIKSTTIRIRSRNRKNGGARPERLSRHGVHLLVVQRSGAGNGVDAGRNGVDAGRVSNGPKGPSGRDRVTTGTGRVTRRAALQN
ncbi:hypothetical protein FA95DRAFT_1653533 [Auriscalpium vulgare]|uniref:Uncharacterized protein n=1 Tax=Auriscalpium vulgare TaxID=40419 RepID=A0ACB8R717_9AGAM|nr:hypothetical protein FA95DRAFT_1653533 [Auriscalpium vulgare]